MSIAVLGAGAWGTAIAIALARRHSVTLWARNAGLVEAIRAARSNERYLPAHEIPPELALTCDMPEALARADVVLAAVATNGLREVLASVRQHGRGMPVVLLCKGYESERNRLPHEICVEALGSPVQHAVLSGPSFAEEVARGLPTALTLAAAEPDFARAVAQRLHGANLRVYVSDDVTGVAVAGAVKNVMAIAAGVSDGLQLGLNARAALITRGLAEMTRFGVALGARAGTFTGLTGIGDLILTCTGDLSRNRRVGLALARGMALSQVLENLGHTAEGVHTAREVARRARELAVDMPVTHAVCRVLERPHEAPAAVHELLAREQKSER